jgi:histidine triad (HIT) family protein
MATIFTKIINGEIPCYKIAENDEFLAFLDIRPRQEGHTLVIPKKEIDYIFDIEDDMLARMITFAKKTALAVEAVIECERIGIMVVGLEVPHAHIHLIPMKTEADLFNRKGVKLTADELSAIAARIREAHAKLF